MANDINLHNLEMKHHPRIREMFGGHEVMWNGHAGDIKVAERALGLKKDHKPFKLAPYRPEQISRQLRSFELKKEPDAGVIEPAVSNWAAPASLSSKRTVNYAFVSIIVGLTRWHRRTVPSFLAWMVVSTRSDKPKKLQRYMRIQDTGGRTFGRRTGCKRRSSGAQKNTNTPACSSA